MKSQRQSNISEYLSELEIERIPSPYDNTVDNGQKSPSEVPLPNDNSVGDEQNSSSKVSNDDQVSEKKNKTKKSAAITPL